MSSSKVRLYLLGSYQKIFMPIYLFITNVSHLQFFLIIPFRKRDRGRDFHLLIVTESKECNIQFKKLRDYQRNTKAAVPHILNSALVCGNIKIHLPTHPLDPILFLCKRMYWFMTLII